jgi:cytochrome b561
MHTSRNKIPSKKSRQAALRGGISSGVKGVIYILMKYVPVAGLFLTVSSFSAAPQPFQQTVPYHPKRALAL